MPTTPPQGTPMPPSQPLQRWRWLTTQSKARGRDGKQGCPGSSPLLLLLHPHPFRSLCPLPACVSLPGAAVSSKGERENRYSDTSDPRAVTPESSRCSPPGPACPWPRWPQPDADCRPAALLPPAPGHDLHQAGQSQSTVSPSGGSILVAGGKVSGLPSFAVCYEVPSGSKLTPALTV